MSERSTGKKVLSLKTSPSSACSSNRIAILLPTLRAATTSYDEASALENTQGKLTMIGYILVRADD